MTVDSYEPLVITDGFGTVFGNTNESFTEGSLVVGKTLIPTVLVRTDDF